MLSASFTRVEKFRGQTNLEEATLFLRSHLPVASQENRSLASFPGTLSEGLSLPCPLVEAPTQPYPLSSPLLLLVENPLIQQRIVRAQDLLERIMLNQAYEQFPHVGEAIGGFFTAQRVVFFKGHNCPQSLFYRKQGPLLTWSTNPTDLLTHEASLNNCALLACCQAVDAWIYRDLSWVPAGSLVEITPGQVKTFPLPREPELPPPLTGSLQAWAKTVYECVLSTTRPLAQVNQSVGVLLSGGIDSAALAAALVRNGARVLAYHLWFAQPEAREDRYARDVCTALGIPLRLIPASSGQDLLSDQGCHIHPYGHPGYRWFVQVAQRMKRDGVGLLITGRYGDAAFGPLERYGLADILSAPIPLREKWRCALHTLSTNWTLPDLALSCLPRSSLITTRSLTRSEQGGQPVRRADFLRVQDHSGSFLQYSDFAGERTIDFSPQDLAIEQIWQRHGIHVVHPYGDPAMQALVSTLPTPYRFFAYQGQKITKPILRLAFAHCLPATVIRRNHGSWISAAIQQCCIEQREWLIRYLGQEESRVVQLGIVDPHKLQAVLQRTRTIRANAYTLSATAMVETFLRTGPLSWERSRA